MLVWVVLMNNILSVLIGYGEYEQDSNSRGEYGGTVKWDCLSCFGLLGLSGLCSTYTSPQGFVNRTPQVLSLTFKGVPYG